MEENEKKKMDLDIFWASFFFQMKHDETIQVAHCLVIEPPRECRRNHEMGSLR